ncbi:fimbrial protein [Morganella morganii]
MKKILIASSLFALTSSAFAVDGTLHFTGAFTDAPCEVNINGATATGTINVALDSWSIANYQTSGVTTDLKPITISLSGCPDMTSANIQFNGTANGTNPDLFAIETGAGTATNVGIALYSSTNTADIITPNKFSGLVIPLTSQAGEHTVYASYMTTGSATEGAANANVTIDISYQ